MENIRTSELSVADDNTFIPQNNNFKNKSLGDCYFHNLKSSNKTLIPKKAKNKTGKQTNNNNDNNKDRNSSVINSHTVEIPISLPD